MKTTSGILVSCLAALLARGAAGADEPGEEARRAPRARSAFSESSAPSANERGSDDASVTERRASCDELVLKARQALAGGDTRRATALAQQAADMNLEYEPGDDSPTKALAAIEQLRRLNARPSSTKKSEEWRRQHAALLLRQAEVLTNWRDFETAEGLCDSVSRTKLAFGPHETSPDQVMARIAEEKERRTGRSRVEPLPSLERRTASDRRRESRFGDVRRANAEEPAARRAEDETTDAERRDASRALYEPENDTTRDVPASSNQGLDEENTPAGDGQRLFDQGEEALKARDGETALRLFREAYTHRDELDPLTLQRLQDHLTGLSRRDAETIPSGDGEPASAEVAAERLTLARQVRSEWTKQAMEARRVAQAAPKDALVILQNAKAKLEQAPLEGSSREQLLRLADREIADLQAYLDSNRPRIELDERNQTVEEEIERNRRVKVEVQEKLARLVDDFNKLVDEKRYEEAEVLAKQAAQLAPGEIVVVQLKNTIKTLTRVETNNRIREAKENGFYLAMNSVDDASIPFDDSDPYRHPNLKTWQDLTKRRRDLGDGSRRSPKTLEIEQRLKAPVSLSFQGAPLSDVLEHLRKVSQVNFHLDERGLGEEGVSPSTPITIDLNQDISLKSALNLILGPLGLGYVIKNEVLVITSEQLKDTTMYTETYNVSDLVIPIPNFVPSNNVGLQAALNTANARVPMNWGAGMGGGAPINVLANSASSTGELTAADVMAQVNGGESTAAAAGPGGAGGAAQPDFDSLIELITSTVAPETWDEGGGDASIQPFPGNLSLVISATQENHEKIADLLEQLRRLQDLQVTIEVRFITLNDNFFERIGLDFDFQLNSNIDKPFQIFGRVNPAATNSFPTVPTANVGIARNVQDRNLRRSQAVTVGLAEPGVFSSDMDIQFNNGSQPLAVPQFGGFQPGSGLTTGFAILSQIESFFFIEAAQGDRRSNVLQAPKVTLFNGQTASVNDISQSPFVISLIPVVGDFAAAQMPVIVVLNQGTRLSVQAVVSPDRRFVRLTVVPYFSRIGDVNTFTFNGTESTTDDTSSEGPDDKTTTKKSSKRTRSREGTTVQLPTFSFVTVSTTVSVPDGGTVLLGGIKRLSEGRNEFGVPILNKVPYLNRLFKNVGIGRETQSLMMMVTPRIIIQEEEETLLGMPPQP